MPMIYCHCYILWLKNVSSYVPIQFLYICFLCIRVVMHVVARAKWLFKCWSFDHFAFKVIALHWWLLFFYPWSLMQILIFTFQCLTGKSWLAELYKNNKVEIDLNPLRVSHCMHIVTTSCRRHSKEIYNNSNVLQNTTPILTWL